ncbi:oxidoreductase [Aureivirga sp. CE67]|uniref:oxidoreductase n=1 Tax=Aureivirga sp. CE67 TaxID=1788983 RepID=UPI0018CAB54D|nr:oxidoreductase [Aureivirga sp. CE67]
MSKNWNTNNIPFQNEKVFLITGANSGLGFGTTLELAKKGAEIIMAVRNLEKGREAVNKIKSEVPNAKLDLMQLDLGDLNSIKEFSEKFKSKYSKLHVLINNAGVMMPVSKQITKQGFELQFGTNHIGHFTLTKYLFPVLNQTLDARIVTLSSLVAKMDKADIYWNDLQWDKSYDKMASYAQSKLSNMMFGMELSKLLKENNSHVKSILAHPGYTATNLQKHMGVQGIVMNFLLAQKVKMGILPSLRAATDPNAKCGEYYGPEKMGNWRGYPVLNEINPDADKRDLTQKLWLKTEELSGVKFEWN